MKCLVVLAAFLTVSSACLSSMPIKVKPFNCQAPNNKGLQAAFDELDKYQKEDLPFLADSRALGQVVMRLISLRFPNARRNESLDTLNTYFCEKVFIDLDQYKLILHNLILHIAATPLRIPPIEKSQYGEEFANYVKKIHDSEKYKRFWEILDYHIATDEYAALGMSRLRSLECKKHIIDVMSTDRLSKLVSKMESYGIYYEDLVDLFAYLTLSSWEYEKQ